MATSWMRASIPEQLRAIASRNAKKEGQLRRAPGHQGALPKSCRSSSSVLSDNTFVAAAQVAPFRAFKDTAWHMGAHTMRACVEMSSRLSFPPFSATLRGGANARNPQSKLSGERRAPLLATAFTQASAAHNAYCRTASMRAGRARCNRPRKNARWCITSCNQTRHVKTWSAPPLAQPPLGERPHASAMTWAQWRGKRRRSRHTKNLYRTYR